MDGAGGGEGSVCMLTGQRLKGLRSKLYKYAAVGNIPG